MNIQQEIQKIHSQFGTTELANYKIQLLFETVIKKTYEETMRGMTEWFINNKNKEPEEAESAIEKYIYPRLKEQGIEFQK